MREIKFRAWDKVTKKMLYDFNITSFGEIMQSNGCVNTDDSFILMQYTGLNDKNGEEIYEGDILLRKNKEGFEYEYDVSWSDGGFIFGAEDVLNGENINEFKLKVIGNIYQNGNLLDNSS